MTVKRTTPMAATHMRNVGISAHVDAGKTTLTERILFFTGRIHRMGEVHDRDGRGATMDSESIEKAHGITVRSAATRVMWRERPITIIDTPGHADFTLEVERSLAVLEGAVFVLSAVEGVQAQSLTVDRQMRTHGTARVAFINKMDRVGADPVAVVDQLRQRLDSEVALVSLPIGAESSLRGVVDLVEMRALAFEGEHGQEVSTSPIPEDLRRTANQAREALVDAVSRVDTRLLELALEGDVTADHLRAAIRRATVSRAFVPVLVGSAYRNIGVQPVLDAIVDYLPSPVEGRPPAEDAAGNPVVLRCDDTKPPVGFVFKVDHGRFGQLSYVRLYQGQLRKGSVVEVVGARVRSLRVGRLVRLHAGSMEELAQAGAGEIVGIVGADLESGQTLRASHLDVNVLGFEVPQPVVSKTIEPKRNADLDRLERALAKAVREDPSLAFHRDAETGQTLISGQGVLALDLLAEKLEVDEGLEVRLGRPRVAYRERITQEVDFEHLHRKQSGGGAGQYAGVSGRLVPTDDLEPELRFAERIRGGAIPREYFSACQAGFASAIERGPLIGAPVLGVSVELLDGKTHSNDSSDLAFRLAARDALKGALRSAQPELLEPTVRVWVEAPTESFGAVQGALAGHRASIVSTEVGEHNVTLVAIAPLAEMFDFADELSSLSGGRASHAMSTEGYAPVPKAITRAIIESQA